MKNITLKKTISIIIAANLLVIIMIYFSYSYVTKPYTKIINMNWQIKLPSSCNEIYSTNSGASFHGDGQRYHVLEYKDSSDIKSSLEWNTDINNSFEKSIIRVLDDLEVASKLRPNLSNKYIYYKKTEEDNSKIYLLYFEDNMTLYVVEDIF